MIVKTIILASLFIGSGIFPLHAEKITENMKPQQTKGIRVSGTVRDKEKNALIGVSVAIKGMAGGTNTDLDGHFYLEVPDKQSTLVITYIGFNPHCVLFFFERIKNQNKRSFLVIPR